jgi:hypothetical protein
MANRQQQKGMQFSVTWKITPPFFPFSNLFLLDPFHLALLLNLVVARKSESIKEICVAAEMVQGGKRRILWWRQKCCNKEKR